MPRQRNYVYWDGEPAQGPLKHWWRFVYDDSNKAVWLYRGLWLLLLAAIVAVGVVAVAHAILTGGMNSAYPAGHPFPSLPHHPGRVNLGTPFGSPVSNWPALP